MAARRWREVAAATGGGGGTRENTSADAVARFRDVDGDGAAVVVASAHGGRRPGGCGISRRRAITRQPSHRNHSHHSTRHSTRCQSSGPSSPVPSLVWVAPGLRVARTIAPPVTASPGQRVAGSSHRWAMCLWVIEPLGHESLGHRFAGTSRRWDIAPLGHRVAGPSHLDRLGSSRPGAGSGATGVALAPGVWPCGEPLVVKSPLFGPDRGSLFAASGEWAYPIASRIPSPRQLRRRRSRAYPEHTPLSAAGLLQFATPRLRGF